MRALTAEATKPEYEAETLRLMRDLVDSAVRRDGEEVARRSRAIVERSARNAIALLRKQNAEDASRVRSSSRKNVGKSAEAGRNARSAASGR